MSHTSGNSRLVKGILGLSATYILYKLLNKQDTSNMSQVPQHGRKLLMIPGPTEFDEDVLKTLGEPSPSHVAPDFIAQFSETLKLLRQILYANNECQPFILSGGGSIGWDCIVSSLCDSNENDKALIINTGYFSDNFAKCCKSYDIKYDQIHAKNVGNIVSSKELELYFKNNENNNNYKLICITHVDTSTAIINPVKELTKIIRKYCNKSTLIAVDGVCSFAGEKFYFSDWDIDACMTASQKALGCPPGLCVMMLSKNAINTLTNRKTKINSFYCDLTNWLPIMNAYEERRVAYFSTPNTNLIKALNISCRKLIAEGMDSVFARHDLYSEAFKNAMESLNLTFVPTDRSYMANTLSAVRFPQVNGSQLNGKEFLGYVKEYGVVFAGGLHKQIKTQYFRVGHMGISTLHGREDLMQCVKAVEYGLRKCGYQFEPNVAVRTFLQTMKQGPNSKL